MKLATSSTIPTSGQCREHLKLLEALHLLREDVATTDGLYGIYDRFVDDVYPGKELDEKRAQLLLKLREKRWAIYVTNAERRYTIWFETLPSARRSMPGQQALVAISEHFEETSGKPGFAFDSVTLPPLDVLMVWHAHLLNPHDFLEDCIRYDKKLVWDTGLPLPIISQCINNETFEYRTSEKAPDHFRRTTGLRWDSFDDDQQPILNCPKCAQAKQVVWTTLTTADFWREPNYRDRGSGLADPEFAMSCDRCFTTSTHEALRVRKFQKDRKALLEKDLPMPGTYLNTKGRLPPIVNLSSHAPFFPNNLLKSFRSPRFEKLDKPGTSIHDVREIIEQGIEDLPTRGLRPQKFAVRKMMSRYWSNSSIFALDLVGAVIRQGTFIEKMHAIDWLHSPAVQSTMNRLLTKYGRYFTILKLNRGKTAVPTLDVDLAW
ncbi:MAG: hypothetical protein L6R38_001558 [Xanthoria sp. 2 TBL-2021]|nr:MAG: hypothetical protein L6R38_001558 [Xanthoria sp. 2 TBL-2021]